MDGVESQRRRAPSKNEAKASNIGEGTGYKQPMCLWGGEDDMLKRNVSESAEPLVSGEHAQKAHQSSLNKPVTGEIRRLLASGADEATKR